MERSAVVRSSFVLLCMCALAAPSALYAQALGAEPLTVRINPAYPRPYQTVQVSAQSTLVNLAASTVRITANGALIREVSGTEAVAITLGGPGTATTITVSVSGPDGTYQKSVTIRPADVALVVDALSVAHPFYQGAPLISSQSRVRLVALPDFRTSSGARIDPTQLSYTWKAGERLLTAESGIGKNVLLVEAPVRYRDTQVSIRVSTSDGSVASESVTTISPIDPILIMYRNDPLLGIDYTNAVSDQYVMEDTEDTFRAVPFFFASRPSLIWTMNTARSGNEPDITVRTTGEASGTALLKAEATTGATGFQSAANTLRVRYGETNSTNLFGF